MKGLLKLYERLIIDPESATIERLTKSSMLLKVVRLELEFTDCEKVIKQALFGYGGGTF
ncbi:MAG: hypothetical protein JKY80_04280 [Mariprofundaceae bacterium]|nr:hypothetical protein [Mariprofundaceae bacterium]